MRQSQNRLDFIAIGFDYMIGAAILGEIQSHLGSVDRDDLSRAKRLQNLNTYVTEPAGTNSYYVIAWEQMARRLLRRMIGGQSGVGVRGDILGRERIRKFDHGALGGLQK